MNKRRFFLHARLGALAAALALSACAPLAPNAAGGAPIPIVFVHGNGDSAALWLTTLWRFESNGWPRDRLHAIDAAYPLSRDDDTKEQPGRSSTTEHAQALARDVEAVLARTGASKVALVGNSRGGNAIRHYIQNLGGAAKVETAVLGGTPNHGVWANAATRPNAEFNGAGPFLMGLNAPKGPNGDEVTPGVKWFTLRSDNNDKFAQPDGVWIGSKGVPTNVTADGPALKGATNVVLPQRDHREVSFHAEAFAKTFEFVAGRAPARLDIVAQTAPVLDGVVSGHTAAGPTNLPLAGATLEVFAVNANTGERLGAAVHTKTIAADGRWGPFTAQSSARYEFVVSAPGFAQAHVYRSPFPRSSNVVHFRVERLADADKAAQAVVAFTRPRGYFGAGRDTMQFDGQNPPPGVTPGVAGVSASRLRLADSTARTISAEFNGERITGRTWPVSQGHLTVLELHH
jgi:triacylglycerol lipase